MLGLTKNWVLKLRSYYRTDSGYSSVGRECDVIVPFFRDITKKRQSHVRIDIDITRERSRLLPHRRTHPCKITDYVMKQILTLRNIANVTFNLDGFELSTEFEDYISKTLALPIGAEAEPFRGVEYMFTTRRGPGMDDESDNWSTEACEEWIDLWDEPIQPRSFVPGAEIEEPLWERLYRQEFLEQRVLEEA